MKPGTVVRLPDGREGTVVFHGLIGYGIQWGRKEVNVAEIQGGDGNTFQDGVPPGWRWAPDALLRAPFDGAYGHECVGGDYVIVEEPRQ